jgi:hypothetical protein
MKEAVKLHVVCTSSNNDRHPFLKTFTPLHYNSPHFNTLVDTSLLLIYTLPIICLHKAQLSTVLLKNKKFINSHYCQNTIRQHLFPWRNSPPPPSGLGPPHCRCFTITLRHTTIGRTPLDE